jgi:hypothetical protein
MHFKRIRTYVEIQEKNLEPSILFTRTELCDVTLMHRHQGYVLEDRRGDGGGPQASHTLGWRGQPLARAP